MGNWIQQPYTRTMYVYLIFPSFLSLPPPAVEAKVTRLRIVAAGRFPFLRPPLVSRERNKTKRRASPRMTLASIAGFKRVVRQLPRVHFPFCPTAISSGWKTYLQLQIHPYIPFPPRHRWKTMSRARPPREILKIFHPVSMIDGYGSSSNRVKHIGMYANTDRYSSFLLDREKIWIEI